MISRTTGTFRKAFSRLPEHVQRQARDAYRLFRDDSYHPSLWFKQVHPTRPIYSIRVSRGYRAVGTVEGDTVIWYWIGSHGDYQKLISRM